MESTKLFWVLLLGVVASSVAASVVVDEKSVVELGDQDDRESNVTNIATSEENGERGFWKKLNILKTSAGESRCTCDNIACECCVNPTVPIKGKVNACLKVTIMADQKSINLQLTGQGRNLIGHRFNVGSKERICAEVPGSSGALKGCVDTETNNLAGNAGVQTCPKLELRAVGKAVATLSFACIQYSNRRVSLNDNGWVKAHQKVNVKFF